MKSALILGRINGAGLDRDAALLGEALAGGGVTATCPPWKDPRTMFSHALDADIAFHLERVAPWWWRRKARLHFLIPNQERFPERLLGKLRRIDRILCKTRHAAEIFRQHHPNTDFIGFTSDDRLLKDVTPDYGKFLHLAGRSTFKNTGILLELWNRHPEWPALTLLQHPDNAPDKVPDNVDLIRRHLPDTELRELQNSHGVHLCPSISEGWGHYLAEAMSCRAVTVTTDAPPMNELVIADRGVLVPYHCSEPRHLGRNYYVDPAALETAIQSLVAMPRIEAERLGRNARTWYLENHDRFTQTIADCIDEIPRT